MEATNGLSLSFHQLVESRSVCTVLEDTVITGTPEFVNRTLVPSTHVLISIWHSVEHLHHTGKAMPLRQNLASQDFLQQKHHFKSPGYEKSSKSDSHTQSPNHVFMKSFWLWFTEWVSRLPYSYLDISYCSFQLFTIGSYPSSTQAPWTTFW